MKLIMGKLSKKNKALISIQVSLSKIVVALAEENRVQDPSYNRVAEFEDL